MRPPPIQWSTPALSCQLLPHLAAPLSNLDLRTVRLQLQSHGNQANTNGTGLSMQLSAPPLGPVHAATLRGQTRALLLHASASTAANRSLDGIEKSQHLLAEASRHWKSCPVFWLRGCIPVDSGTGHHGTRARRIARAHGLPPKPASRPSPHLRRRRRFRRQTIKRPTLPPLRPRARHRQLAGQHNSTTRTFWRRQWPPDSPSRRASGLPVLLAACHGPAAYICDATVVSKGFRRLRAGHDMVSRGNHDTWTAIRAAADQRDTGSPATRKTLWTQWIPSRPGTSA